MLKRFKDKREREAADQAHAQWVVECQDLYELVVFAQAAVENGGRVDKVQFPFLKQGESVLVNLNVCTLVEMRRQGGSYEGGSHGVSVRVAKGVSYRVGAGRGTYVPGPEMLTDIDVGQLTVTTSRVLFSGPGKSREWKYENLIDLAEDPSTGLVMMGVTNRQKTSGIRLPFEVFKTVTGRIDVAVALNAGQGHEFAQELDESYRALLASEPAMRVPE